MRHIKLVISDCHLGTGAFLPDGAPNPLEDFRKDEKFVEFLDYFTTGDYADAQVELVINGDFFDMLQASTTGETPYEIFENIAVRKIKRILAGHPRVMMAFRQFIDRGHHIKYIWGNHDAGIRWPAVQEEIRQVIGPKLEFSFDPYEFDGIRIEHGHQYELIHEFDTERIFIETGGRKLLNYPFGSFFVAGFLTKLKAERHYISQVVPFSKFLRWAMIFDFWYFVKQGFRVAFFFFKMRFIYHPYRFARISKTFQILAELLNRPEFHEMAPDILKKTGARVLIMGHNHEAMHRIFSDGTQYLNTGTWTDITSFDPGQLGRLSRPTYALIEYPPNTQPGQAGALPRVALQVWRGRHREWEQFEL